jgi:16S rRNA (guanine527-N7)-methyltransferase
MDLILKYFTNLSGLQKEQFEKLGGLYTEWNAKINVISRKDIEQLYLHHVLHSLAIAKYIGFKPGTKIMDIGTGGGFPGIPLAILFPDTHFLLVDSVGKKIKVVQAVMDGLGLNNCKAVQSRCEDIKGKFDFVVSRAVGPMTEIVGWVKKSVSTEQKNDLPNGIIFLKGGELEGELNLPYPTRITEIQQYFEEPFFETKKIVHLIFERNK